MMKSGYYRHFKGNIYEVMGVAIHSETREELVVYKPIGSALLFVGPKAMFEGYVINSNGDEQKRFEYCIVSL